MKSRNLVSQLLPAVFMAFILVHGSSCYAASLGVRLPDDYLYSKGKIKCGFINGKWEAGQLKKSLFTSYAARIADLKKKLRKAKGASRASLNKQLAAAKKNRSRQNKQVCSKLTSPVKTPTPSATPALPAFSGLRKIPAASNLVRASAQPGTLAVSGQPPALIDIPGMDVKALYWEAGLVESIIAGTADANQCRDFWFGDQDGDSGGMNACNMTGQMGYTFSPIMSAGVSLCRLKSLPNPQLFSSGAVELVSGTMPADPAGLFDSPETPRLVKIQILGPRPELLFVQTYSRSQNSGNGYQFHADIWQCGNQSNQANTRHSIVVNNDNQYLYGFYSHENNFSAGGHQFTVDASLDLDSEGNPRFDLTKDRHALAEHIEADGSFGFRQDITIAPENLLKVKSRWLFSYGWRTDYIVSSFTGTGIRDLRLWEGGIKAQDHNNGEPVNDSLTGTEYRDTTYAAAPAASLVSQASTADFGSDTFFSNPPAVQIDTSAFLCDVKPDISLIVHADTPAIGALFSSCDQFTIWNTNFCGDNEALSQASQKWPTFCPGLIAGG